MKTALVLGAGGASGWVYHAAVLDAAREFGFEASEADVIVGTSAGASLAAAIRAGIAPESFTRTVTRPPTAEERRAMMNELRAARKSIRPLAPGLIRELAPRGRGLSVALAGLLPKGLFPTDWVSSLPGVGERTFPSGLWVPAVKLPAGEVVVFGRDRTDVPLDVAVKASSAVPGMFRPVHVGDELFVDGGVASSTHADTLVDADVERIVVSAPMSRDGGGPFARNARRRLRHETVVLRASGREVVVIEPSAETVVAAKGFPRRRPEAATAIFETARTSARTVFARAS